MSLVVVMTDCGRAATRAKSDSNAALLEQWWRSMVQWLSIV